MDHFDKELTERWRARMPKFLRDRFAGVYREDLGDGVPAYFVGWTEDYVYDRTIGGEYPVRTFREGVELLRYLSPAR